jgi:UPF0755 protein
VSSSDQPPKKSDRAGTPPPRVAPPRGAEKPALPAPTATAGQSAKAPPPATAKPAPRPAVVPAQAKAVPAASVAPNPRPAAAAGDKAAKAVAPRPAIANGGAPRPAATARPAPAATGAGATTRAVPAAARPAAAERPVARGTAPQTPGKAVSISGEPQPLLGRPGNGNGADAARSKIATNIAPRSPRAALEPDAVELPTKRSTRARHPFVVIGNAILSLFVLLAIVAAIALVAGKQRFEAPGPLAEDRVVNIPRGSGFRDIADVLVRDGVIDQPWVFIGGVLVLKAREDLKAGEYQFKAHASLRDVVATIVDGRVVPHQLTIPEGLTSEQIVARLLEDDILTGNIKEVPREGTLLPDTYSFTRGITREQMIQRMQQAQQRVVKEVWDRHSPDLPIKTPDQLVTLASIVEKETGKPDERTRVAAVFVNRLKQKMRLQSDPTIIYGLVGGKGTLGRPIMRSEIEQATPYNTYQIEGLPPGPIANPGRASLEAAANPARTRELYFVADGTGGHAFAETYEQHQKNVARLRAMESDQRAEQPAASDAPQSAAPQASGAPAPQQRRTTTPARHNQNPSATTH